MDPETQKALYTNLLLMAYADGKLDAGENAFVEAVRVRAGISVDEAARYRRELASGAIAFRSVGDRRSALLIAKAAIGAVSSDGEFHRSERYALLELGKAIGLTRDELQALVYEYFKRDVLAELFPETKPEPAEPSGEIERPSGEASSVVIVVDDFPALERFAETVRDVFRETAPEHPVEIVSLRGGEAALKNARLIFFHVLEDRASSIRRFQRIRAIATAEAAIVFIAERGQAYQIGYLLDEGADACLIAPVYPEELPTLLERLPR